MGPKKLIGKGLITVCETFPITRPYLERLGMRTKPEWFGDRIVKLRLPSGRTLRLASAGADYLSFNLFWRGISYHEPFTAALARELIDPGGTFFDIGANIGFYSLILAADNPACKIVAFEPSPEIFALLESNIKANGFDSVCCERIALSEACGKSTLFLSGSHMSASLEKGFSHLQSEAIETRTDTIDNYVHARGVQGQLVIKMDVEGHEQSTMRGARAAIAKLRPDIIVEVARPHATDPYPFLKDLGYNYYQITNKGLELARAMAPTIREQYWFPNYLLSVRPAQEIERISRAVEARCLGLNLDRTCLAVDEEKVKRLLRE